MTKTELFAASAAALTLACVAGWAVLDTQARAANPRTGQIDPLQIMTSTKQLPSQHFADYSFVFWAAGEAIAMKPETPDAGQAQCSQEGMQPKVGMLHSIFTLDEGPVTLIAPATLSETSYSTLADLIEQYLRRAKRDANNNSLAQVQ
jgi:hypothetical protein